MATTPSSNRWLWLMGAGIILTTSAVYLTSVHYYWSHRLEHIRNESKQPKAKEKEADKVERLEDSIPLDTLKQLLKHPNTHIRIAAERIVLSRFDRDPSNAADLLARLASPDRAVAREARTQAVNMMHLRESLSFPTDPALAAATRASFEAARVPPPRTDDDEFGTSAPLGSMHGFRELKSDELTPFAAGSEADDSPPPWARTEFASPFLWRHGAFPPTPFHFESSLSVMPSDVPRREELRRAPAAAWRLTPALRDSPWLSSLENTYHAAGLSEMDPEVLRDQMFVRALMVSMPSHDPFHEVNRVAYTSADVEMTDAAEGDNDAAEGHNDAAEDHNDADNSERRYQGSLFVEELEST